MPNFSGCGHYPRMDVYQGSRGTEAAMVDRMKWFAESDVLRVCDRSCWTGGGSDLGISGSGRLGGDEATHAAQWVRPPRAAGGATGSEASTRTLAGGADTVAAGRVAVAGRRRHCHGRHRVQGGQARNSRYLFS